MVSKLGLIEAKEKKFLPCLMDTGHSLQIPVKVVGKYGFFPTFSPNFYFIFRMSLECPKLPVFFFKLHNYIISIICNQCCFRIRK